MFRVTFWGVRGSIPSPGPQTARIGGNTSCVEVRVGDHLLLFDGGTGLRVLGEQLLSQMPLKAHLFFSHVHWDHIQGFPFFTPAFVPGNVFHLYGAHKLSETLEETLAGQMEYPNFPVTLKSMGSSMHFRDLLSDEQVLLDEGRLKVYGVPGNHPQGVFAYRVEYDGKVLVYATDTEHPAEGHDPNILRVAQDADVFIYDAQYTPEEYLGSGGKRSKVGWGHSTMLEGAALAKSAGAKQLVLYHHDPNQSDAAVLEKERRAREHFGNTIAAYESLALDLSKPESR